LLKFDQMSAFERDDPQGVRGVLCKLALHPRPAQLSLLGRVGPPAMAEDDYRSNAQNRTWRTRRRTPAHASVGLPSPPSSKTTGPLPLQTSQRWTCGATSTALAKWGARFADSPDEHAASTSAHAPRQTSLIGPRINGLLDAITGRLRVTFTHAGPCQPTLRGEVVVAFE
jgi:hypothetical protein